jgi:hypothetical protein
MHHWFSSFLFLQFASVNRPFGRDGRGDGRPSAVTNLETGLRRLQARHPARIGQDECQLLFGESTRSDLGQGQIRPRPRPDIGVDPWFGPLAQSPGSSRSG